jgi:hypothetical protein
MKKHNSGIDGPGKKDTYFMRLAQRESAKIRQCPICNRKSAMVITYEDFVSGHVVRQRICRWCKHIENYKSEEYQRKETQ